MRKKILILVCFLFVSFFLTACYDAAEIGEYAYITMFGIDLGVSDTYRVTYHIPKFNQGVSQSGGGSGGGGDKEEEKVETLTIDAPSMLSATGIANTNLSKVLNYMHLKAIIVSEELAKSGLLAEYIGPITRYRQVRRTTNVIICKGSAEEFIKSTKPYLGELVTQTIEELLRRSEIVGFFPKLTLDGLYDGIKSPYHALLGTYGAINKGENYNKDGSVYDGEFKIPGDYYAGDVPRNGGQEVELFGSAVLDGDKMVGKLTGFETQMLLLVRNELKSAFFTIPDPEAPEMIIPIEIKEFELPKTTIDLSGDKPKIQTKLSLEGNITEIQSRIQYEEPKKKKILEDAFEKFIVEGIERTFGKCKDFKSDVFNFGTTAVLQFWTIPEWEEYNWLKRFPNSELKVEVDFTLRRTGKLLKSEPIYSTEGKE